MADVVRPGVLGGSIEQVLDRIGEYVDAGADQVNLALRAPFDVDALEQFSESLDLAEIVFGPDVGQHVRPGSGPRTVSRPGGGSG